MFCFSLEVRDPSEPTAPIMEIEEQCDWEDDDTAFGVLTDVCEAMDDAGRFAFRVEGFGQHPWPVDVLTDLAVFVVQVAQFQEWLQHPNREAFNLDFYEQGIERTLTLENHGSEVRIACRSRTRWQPCPTHETVLRSELRRMLRCFLETFTRVAGEVAPGLVADDRFEAWRRARFEGSLFVPE